MEALASEMHAARQPCADSSSDSSELVADASMYDGGDGEKDTTKACLAWDNGDVAVAKASSFWARSC